MAVRTWEVSQTCFCEHINLDVALEAQLVYPADILPDQPAQVTGHRCSHGMECNLFAQPACIWAGTLPAHDPFQA
jgi:hypothetical protein